MSPRIDIIINEVLRAEGGYVNDPADRGGETNHGITVAVARANGYIGPMEDMPASVARTIYERRYIAAPGFDRLLEHDADIAAEVIDTGVNMGPAVAGAFLQRSLNAFNSDGRYDDLFVDGRVGPVTANALRDFLAWRGPPGKAALLALLNSLQATRYIDITERDRRQRRFFFGWMQHRVLPHLLD